MEHMKLTSRRHALGERCSIAKAILGNPAQGSQQRTSGRESTAHELSPSGSPSGLTQGYLAMVLGDGCGAEPHPPCAPAPPAQ
eukprot:4506723-Pyramimonas_sp.AAC.1